MIQIKDPRTIVDGFPYIVLANQSNSEIGWGIDIRTDIKGDHPCDHAMTCVKQGKFATQGLTYKEVPMEDYLIDGGWLAFVQLVDNNEHFKTAYAMSVEARLSLPWYKTFYNFVEIFGQAIGQPSISFPGLFDCSMIDCSLLQSNDQYLSAVSQTVINSMSKYLNPEQLLDTIMKHPEVFNLYGVWSSDVGITVQ